MNARTASRQATAFALAALVCLGLMASIDGLAGAPAAAERMAASTSPAAQVVVVTGQRLPRS